MKQQEPYAYAVIVEKKTGRTDTVTLLRQLAVAERRADTIIEDGKYKISNNEIFLNSTDRVRVAVLREDKQLTKMYARKR